MSEAVDEGRNFSEGMFQAFVGRAAELNEVEGALRGACAGRGSTLVLRGEAGVGKTRLAHEVERRAAARDMVTMWGRCSGDLFTLPYLALIEALGGHLDGADCARLRAQLGELAREVSALLPQLDVEAPPTTTPESAHGRLRTFAGLFSLLNLIAVRSGALLVLDDFQLADGATLEFVDYLVRRAPRSRILTLLSFRSQDLPRRHPVRAVVTSWTKEPSVVLVDLRPLGPEHVGSLVEAAIDVALAADLRDLLTDRCEGSPFILEQILEEPRWRAALAGDGGPDAAALASLPLPRTVREAVLALLDQLTPEQLHVIRCAAVLGVSFSYASLAATCELPAAQVESAFHACLDRSLVREDGSAPNRYAFCQTRTREALYQDLIGPVRQRLHALAAEALAGEPGTSSDVCRHLLAAGRLDAAIPACLRAADEAMAAGAYQGAAGLLRMVLPYLDAAAGARARAQLGLALLQSGSPVAAVAELADAIADLEAWGERALAARRRLDLGRGLWSLGRSADASHQCELALHSIEGDPSGSALALLRTGELALLDGDGATARMLAERALDLATEAGCDRLRLDSQCALGYSLVLLGEDDEGFRHLDESRVAALRDQHLDIVARALHSSCAGLLSRYRIGEAGERLAELERLADRLDLRLQVNFLEGLHRSLGLGEPGRALSRLERGLAQAEEGRMESYVQRIRVALAAVHVELDDPQAALAELPPDSPAWGTPLRFWRTLIATRIAAQTGTPDPDLIATVTGAAFGDLPARCRLALLDAAVDLLLAIGDEPGARQLVRSAPGAGRPSDPFADRALGRLTLAAGGPAARELFASAAGALATLGAVHEHWVTRLLLAEALVQGGSCEAAEGELHLVLQSAMRRGARLQERRAREAIALHGFARVPGLNRVKELLGWLRRDGDEAGPARSVALSTQDRQLLVGAIGEMVGSDSSREAEAGRILRDYYVRRIRSHELIANRLNMPRATFYRRLRLGVELLATRIATDAEQRDDRIASVILAAETPGTDSDTSSGGDSR